MSVAWVFEMSLKKNYAMRQLRDVSTPKLKNLDNLGSIISNKIVELLFNLEGTNLPK